MKRSGHKKEDGEWLKKLGDRVEQLIRKRGFESPYDFWIKQAGDDLSRATLNYIVAGKSDPKATTLRALAKLLEVPVSKLMDFDD